MIKNVIYGMICINKLACCVEMLIEEVYAIYIVNSTAVAVVDHSIFRSSVITVTVVGVVVVDKPNSYLSAA